MHNRPRAASARSHPVLLVAAIVVALTAAGSGGAVAGALITGKQIKNESVTGADLKNGTVGSADIADRSLGSQDVADGSLGSQDIADGSLGSQDVADGSLGSQDVANGSLGSADLSTSARQELAGSLASGRAAADAGLSRVRTARGITVSVTRAEQGVYCVVLAGTAVTSDDAVLVATATDPSTIVIADPAVTPASCPRGAWAVRTYVRLADGSIEASDQPFVFQIG